MEKKNDTDVTTILTDISHEQLTLAKLTDIAKRLYEGTDMNREDLAIVFSSDNRYAYALRRPILEHMFPICTNVSPTSMDKTFQMFSLDIKVIVSENDGEIKFIVRGPYDPSIRYNTTCYEELRCHYESLIEVQKQHDTFLGRCQRLFRSDSMFLHDVSSLRTSISNALSQYEQKAKACETYANGRELTGRVSAAAAAYNIDTIFVAGNNVWEGDPANWRDDPKHWKEEKNRAEEQIDLLRELQHEVEAAFSDYNDYE